MTKIGAYERTDMSGTVRLLLVDDDPSLLSGVADLLEISGYEVVTARNGREALQTMQFMLPDLVISDIMMPEMNGYEFFEAVRSNPEWIAIPFVFLTARSQPVDIRKGQYMGADAYLVKPFEPDDLLTTIEGRLNRIKAIHSAAGADVERMKQQLITIFSHELRTPLTYIYGYINLLIDQYDELERELVFDMLGGIQQGADRLLKLVEDLMLMVRINSGVVEMEIMMQQGLSPLGDTIKEVVSKYQSLASQRGVDLISRIDAQAAQFCVSFYVIDVLSRLVENAIKFCKQDGGKVVISAYYEADELVLSVDDNGIGIQPTQLEQVFELFRQVDRDIMEQQGTGLGLPLTVSLIRLHNGSINVKSQSGAGSTFTVRLPVDSGQRLVNGGCSRL
nr:hybrid sensor histidine kinase/response regulator [Anaerolineae bacterium]